MLGNSVSEVRGYSLQNSGSISDSKFCHIQPDRVLPKHLKSYSEDRRDMFLRNNENDIRHMTSQPRRQQPMFSVPWESQISVHFNFCQISGPHSGEYENDSILAYRTVQCRRRRPTFQTCLLPPSPCTVTWKLEMNCGYWRIKHLEICYYVRSMIHVWWLGLQNSPTVTHACRKRRLKWVPSASGIAGPPCPRGS
jgi:hypothetical protein